MLKCKKQKKNVSWILERPFAHRGLHGIDSKGNFFPENSLSSFKRAIDKKYPIELDVQLTSDNIPIVFHDNDLNRICKLNKKISSCSLSELQNYKLFESDEYIPTLDEVLKLINGQVAILIELKSEILPGLLEKKVYQALESYVGKFTIQSFQPATILWFKSRKVNYPLGLIGGNRHMNIASFQSLMIECFGHVTLVLPDYVAFHHKKILRYKWISIFCRWFHIPIIAWTVTSLDDYNKVKNNVHNIIFENFEA